jgi:hypothetical protein
MTRILMILVFALSSSVFALAQTPASSLPHHREWEASGFTGFAFAKDYKFRTVVSGNDQESSGVVGMQYESGYRVGGHVGQDFGRFLGADLEYSFTDQPLRFTNLSPSAQSLYLSHFVHSLIYNVSFSPRTPDKRFRPYVGAGAGALLFYVTGESKAEALKLGIGLRDSWEAAFNFGGGFKHLVADRFALTVDVKSRLSRVPTYGLPRSAQLVDGQYQPALSVRGLMHSWQINFGVAHQWDSW